MRRICGVMTRSKVRAFAIRWLAEKHGGMPPTYRGLDPRRVHFPCGCSITRPTGRARRRGGIFRPGFGPSKVCAGHQYALLGPGI